MIRRLPPVIAGLLLFPCMAAAQSLTVTPSMSATDVTVGEPVRFWISVRNDGAEAIGNLRVVGIDAPGYAFRMNPPCACTSPGCFASKQCAPLKPRLDKGAQFSFWGDLTATASSPSQAAWILMRWETPSSLTQEISIPLGRLTATSRFWLGWQATIGFLKDIAIPAIPLALGAFGFWLQSWERKRAERVADEERTRTQNAETWREMLPLSHDYTIKHYMPVVAAAELAVKKAQELRGPVALTEDQKKRAFFVCMSFRRRVRAQIEALNGFYFKNRCGEELAAALLVRYDELYVKNRPDSLQRRDQILGMLDPTSRYPAFVARWETESASGSALGTAVSDEYSSFQKWMTTPEAADALDVLLAFATIVRLEMNRIYELWYGKPEQMSMKPGAAVAVWRVLAEAAGAGSVSEAQLKAYLTENGCPSPIVTPPE